MSIRYTLRRLTQSDIEGEKFKDNLKDYELAVVKPSGRLVIRLGDNLYDLVNAADNGEIEAIGRAWAVSEQSPDGESDQESPTHQTMSSRSWALNSKASASNAQSYANNANSYKTDAQTAANNAASAVTNAQTAANNAQTYANNAQGSAQTATEKAQQISDNITTINNRLTQSEQNLRDSTVLLNRLIDITDADEVSY